MNIEWVTTAPNPRSPDRGWDQGQRGWRLHAIEATADEKFSDVGKRRSLCGLRPSHGWDLDLFVDKHCRRCELKLAKLQTQQKQNPPGKPLVEVLGGLVDTDSHVPVDSEHASPEV